VARSKTIDAVNVGDDRPIALCALLQNYVSQAAPQIPFPQSG